MTEQVVKVRELAEGYTEAWCSQVAAKVAAFYELEGSLQINGGVAAVGRPAIAEAAQGFMTAFPDLVVVMDGLSIENGGAVYRWTLTGTNVGPGGTGRVVKISGCEAWRIGAEGLIAESKGQFDEEGYRRQLEGLTSESD